MISTRWCWRAISSRKPSAARRPRARAARCCSNCRSRRSADRRRSGERSGSRARHYSLSDVYANVNGGPIGGVGPIALMGLNVAYPDLNLPAILTPYGQSVIADFRGMKCAFEVTASYPFLSDSVLVRTPAILNRADWQARMAQNQSGTGVPSVPALVYAGALDEIVPFDQNQKRFASWCSRGANVAFRTIGATEHAKAFLRLSRRGRLDGTAFRNSTYWTIT
ncbi:lipase family protein [Ralstonia pseudosolanacearum]|uniref:lipase family protein n=1 Tax=Ralstonia pseudosolanacearum TaxID=1310165 RepID=UPI003AADC8E6